ncbi:MAG: fasciclin domain-containing protein [Chloroflexota bacterium]
MQNALALSARRMTRLLALSVAAVLAVGLMFAPVAAAQQPKDIVDTAVAAGQFTTLVKAVQAAGLVETLKGPGPFTVFAPTDAAFAKLPAGTLDQLLADPAKLKAVLTYHVIPGKVTAAQVTNGMSANTVQGAPLTFQVGGGSVKVNNSATVTSADVMATNGVIHVIDSVLLPPAAQAAPSQLPRAGEAATSDPLPFTLAGLGLLLVGGAVAWRPLMARSRQD